MFVSAAAVLLAGVCLVRAYPGGPPEAACSTLTPSHPNTSKQPGAVPYVIDLDQFETNGSYAYVPGQTYTLTLSDPGGSTFRGFFVQSRVVADGSRVGTFAVINSQSSKLSPCPREEDGIVHDNTARTDFSSMTMRWTAPPTGTGSIQFAYAVVRVFDTYWADQRSEMLEEGRGGSTSVAAVSVWSTVIMAVAVTLKNMI